MRARDHTSGFTLIEISIVIIIIGLIISGVMVGQDLINQARIRQQISQITALTTAVNTFRMKYNGLPGDLLASRAIAAGMTTRTGADGHGDNDTQLEPCAALNITSPLVFGCETALFWSDLSVAKLIAGDFSAATDTTINVSAGQQGLYFPSAKIGNNNYVAAFSGGTCRSLFCFSVARIQTRLGAGFQIDNASLSAMQAFSIDSKIDNGIPDRGKVISGLAVAYVWWTELFIHATPSAAGCLTTDGSGSLIYNTSASSKDTPSCIINFAY